MWTLFLALLFILSCDTNKRNPVFEPIKELSREEANSSFKDRGYVYKNQQEFEEMFIQSNELRKLGNIIINSEQADTPKTLYIKVLPGTNVLGMAEDIYGDLYNEVTAATQSDKIIFHNFTARNFAINFCMYLNHVDNIYSMQTGSTLKIRNIAAMKLKIDISQESLVGHIIQLKVILVSANSSVLVLRNNQDTPMKFQILKGRVFDESEQDNKVQSMIIDNNINVELNALETKTVNVKMFCMEYRKPGPGNHSLMITPFVVNFGFSSQQDVWNVFENM
jgi:hypothetical protein